MSNLVIQCPQPTRSLRRKASQLNDASDNTSSDRLFCRRQNNSSPPPDNIRKWLDYLPLPLNRSRSDSYLMRNYNLGQQRCFSNMPKSRTTPPTIKDVPHDRPLSPHSLQTVIRVHTSISESVQDFVSLSFKVLDLSKEQPPLPHPKITHCEI